VEEEEEGCVGGGLVTSLLGLASQFSPWTGMLPDMGKREGVTRVRCSRAGTGPGAGALGQRFDSLTGVSKRPSYRCPSDRQLALGVLLTAKSS